MKIETSTFVAALGLENYCCILLDIKMKSDFKALVISEVKVGKMQDNISIQR